MCPKKEELRREANQILDRVLSITKAQIEALQANDQAKLLSLDKDLELTFGSKERAFGALREHTKEHGC
jgi:hypothetical protein